MAYITPKEKDVLMRIVNLVLDVVYRYEKDLQYIGYVMEIGSGPSKGQHLLYFKSKIPELADISEISFSVDKIIDAIRAAQTENGEYNPTLLIKLRDNIAKSVLKKINEDVKPCLSSNRSSINSDDVKKIRKLFISLRESATKSQINVYDNGFTHKIIKDEFSLDNNPTPDAVRSEIKKDMLCLIWENISSYEKDLRITASLCKENNNQLWVFNPTDYDQIKYCFVDPEPYLEKLEKTAYSNGFENMLQQAVNEVAEHILNNYVSAIKNIVVSNNDRKASAESCNKKPYHNQFDHKLIDFIKLVFSKGLAMETKEIYSIDLGNNCFEIRASTNTDIHLKMFYLLQGSRAQLQLESILIPQYYRENGISKSIINNLFKFCSEAENTELLIIDVINEDWELYLRTKGAILIKKDEQKGDVLKITDYIA